jgi:gas vesicle protein
MGKAVRFLEGFVLGGLVGVTLALLFAPSTGEELIQRMRSEVERIRSEVQTAASDRRYELEQQLASLKSPRRTSQDGS